MSKTDLYDMLASAVANTPGARTLDGREPSALIPSADQVATAIVAAARALRCDPIAIAKGQTTMGGRFANHNVPRARAYAATALREVFGTAPVVIGRVVAAKNPQQYLNTLDSQRRNGVVRWWDEVVYRAVISSLRGSVTKPMEED